MKKGLVITATMVLTALLFSGCGKTANLITAQEATDIATQNAKVDEKDISMLSVTLDKGLFGSEYDVSFYVGAAEYEFEIDAETGGIKDSDMDTVD